MYYTFFILPRKRFTERRKNCYDISAPFPHERFYLPQSVVPEYTEISPLTLANTREKDWRYFARDIREIRFLPLTSLHVGEIATRSYKKLFGGCGHGLKFKSCNSGI